MRKVRISVTNEDGEVLDIQEVFLASSENQIAFRPLKPGVPERGDEEVLVLGSE